MMKRVGKGRHRRMDDPQDEGRERERGRKRKKSLENNAVVKRR